MSDDAPTITVAIHDRRRFVRRGLRALLSAQPGTNVAATSGTLDEASSRFQGVSLDAIVVGDCRPLSQAEATQRLRQLHPTVEIVALADDSLTTSDGTAMLDAIREPRLLWVDSADAPPTLTPREREVLAGVARGLTAREIAETLGIATRTVEHHKRRLYSKLGVQNQAHAVALAATLGER